VDRVQVALEIRDRGFQECEFFAFQTCELRNPDKGGRTWSRGLTGHTRKEQPEGLAP
jgi:hypothetical protein